MRRALIWLMLCLLPLRLWASDAMAVQHAPATAHHGSAVVLVLDQHAHPCHGVEDTAGAVHTTPRAADADGVAEPSSTHATSHANTDVAGSEHGVGCGDCSVCHGPLAGLTVACWAANTLPAALPQATGWPALSANALPHLKPPRA